MQSPRFDFGASQNRLHRGVLLLLILTSMLFFVSVVRYVSAEKTVADLATELAALERTRTRQAAPIVQSSAERARDEAEYKALRAVNDSLQIPWAALFRAVDTLSGDDVALLSLEPDPKSGTLRVSGEGRNFASVLACVERARARPEFENVYLASHQFVERQAIRSVHFVIHARWNFDAR